MRNISLLIFLLFSIFIPNTPAQYRKNLVIDEARKKRGEEVWEEAIKAKGGRERLEQVTSMADKNGYDGGDFIVFPYGFFRWADARGMGKHGFLIMDHYNFETQTNYSLTTESEIKSRKIQRQDISPKSMLRTRFRPVQLYYFLGLKWFHPKIVDWQIKKYQGKKVDWVRLYPEVYERDTIDVGVYLDFKTHLPMRYEYYTQYSYGEQINEIIELKDYRKNKGIMMPTKVKAKGAYKWSIVDIEIDPEHDPTFFNRPPDPILGFNQWRLRK